ncbi:MAG TPA: phosphoribosylformylglycinamidine synthase, partial [Burkholderiales bacterium]|nr:phosphoribosylformylglycinamidine synthase [Burkholderiales bacterium]
MPQLIRLRGRSALSAFRLRKFLAKLAPFIPDLEFDAEYWHFVMLREDLEPRAHERLERILTYGPSGEPTRRDGVLCLVVPRIGTVSPWSSKATDIAHHCGLTAVERIERGVAYWLSRRLSREERAALAPLIHDRMTETMLGSFDEV